jgi:hypothetical protein
VYLTDSALKSHVHGVGLSRSGKSKLIELIARDLITKRKGFCLIDPHGTLYRDLLDWLAVMDFERDITLFNPSYEKRIVGFNPFQSPYTDEARIMTKVERLVSATMRAWGTEDISQMPRLAKLIKCLYYILIEAKITIPQLDCFLEYDRVGERDAIIAGIQSRAIKAQIQQLYEGGKRSFQSFIESTGNRLQLFSHPQVRRILGTPKCIDVRSITNNQGILLVNLQPSPDDVIGAESNRVLGTLLINELWEVARRRERPVEFYLIIDECHRYLTHDLEEMLQEAAKYGLHLFLFHQDMSQLKKAGFDGAIRNAQTKLFFSTEDEPKLQRHFILRLASQFFFDAEALNVKPFRVDAHERELLIERLTKDFLTSNEIDALFAYKAPKREQMAEAQRRLIAEVSTPTTPTPPLPVPQVQKPEKQTPDRTRPVAPESASVERPLPTSVPVTLGRGGAQHKYLQQLVKRWGEDKGYRATIEKPILGGVGSVDVALERDGVRVACEISITTSVEHELGNIEKCLAADFTHVAFIASEKKVLMKAKKVIGGALSEESSKRVQFFAPEDFLLFLEELDAQAASKEETVRGYKVKVKYRPINEEEKKARKQAISQTIIQALKRLKNVDET